jgi:hypothetical protein
MKFFRDFERAKKNTCTNDFLPFVPDCVLCHGEKATWFLNISPICEGLSRIIIKSNRDTVYSDGYLVGSVGEIKALRNIKPVEVNPNTVTESSLLVLLGLNF